MRKLLLVGVAFGLAACADVSTAPSSPGIKPTQGAAARDLTCRSGYVVAYRSDGTAYCAPDGTTTPTTTTTTTTSTSTTTSNQ